MATEMAQYTLWGMAIGVVVFGILFGYVYFTTPTYTDAQKLELNEMYAYNCTKCLVKENTTCTAATIEYTQWGTVCDLKYIRNCTAACRRF
jgi:hypothetical protein